MNAAPLAGHSASRAAPAPPSQRIAKAARDFEAVLLNSLLGPLEHTFASLPGKEKDTESDSYHSLAMEMLASSLASKGGVGIAALVSKSLSKRHPADAAGTQEKSPARGASLARPF